MNPQKSQNHHVSHFSSFFMISPPVSSSNLTWFFRQFFSLPSGKTKLKAASGKLPVPPGGHVGGTKLLRFCEQLLADPAVEANGDSGLQMGIHSMKKTEIPMEFHNQHEVIVHICYDILPCIYIYIYNYIIIYTCYHYRTSSTCYSDHFRTIVTE